MVVLAQYVSKYGLHAMTELVHPYFVLIIGILAGLFPLHKYYTNMKNNLVVGTSSTQINSEMTNIYNYMKQRQGTILWDFESRWLFADILDKLQRQIEAEVLKNETNRVRIEQEVKSLRKEMRNVASKKTEGIGTFRRRAFLLT